MRVRVGVRVRVRVRVGARLLGDLHLGEGPLRLLRGVARVGLVRVRVRVEAQIESLQLATCSMAVRAAAVWAAADHRQSGVGVQHPPNARHLCSCGVPKPSGRA